MRCGVLLRVVAWYVVRWGAVLPGLHKRVALSREALEHKPLAPEEPRQHLGELRLRPEDTRGANAGERAKTLSNRYW